MTRRSTPGLGDRARTFIDTYTRDRTARDLQRVFTRETREMLAFFTQGTDEREASWNDVLRHPVRHTRAFFMALAMRLTPARRLLYGTAIVLFLLGVRVSSPNEQAPPSLQTTTWRMIEPVLPDDGTGRPWAVWAGDLEEQTADDLFHALDDGAAGPHYSEFGTAAVIGSDDHRTRLYRSTSLEGRHRAVERIRAEGAAGITTPSLSWDETQRWIVCSDYLGPLDATMLVAGGMGSGIFLVPGLVAAEVGAPGLAILGLPPVSTSPTCTRCPSTNCGDRRRWRWTAWSAWLAQWAVASWPRR